MDIKLDSYFRRTYKYTDVVWDKSAEENIWTKQRGSKRTELNDLYSSPNIIRMIKWRRMRWAGNVARMEVTINDTHHFGRKI
jgi:hypothetical protein